MDDDVDAANEVADARFAEVDKAYIGLVGSDDDDDDDDEDNEEALMDVTDDEDDDDDDDDDEDSEEDDDSEDDDEDGERDDENDDETYSESEEAALAKAMKAQKKRLEGKVRREQVMSEDESESEDADEGFGIRGKKKTDFYGDDDVDHEGLSDEEDRIEEEKEARRMRKLMAQEMRAEDFGVDSEDEEEATLGAKAADLRRGDGKSKSASRGGVEIETLTAEERDERLAAEDGAAAANDAPELMALTKELTSTLSAIEASVEPLVNAARDGAFATAEGISYLDTKYLLMLSYCSSIVFYLLLKAEGRSVKDHPVIERLVEIRLYLEKLRPIDKKLQYQVRYVENFGFIFAFL
jgi:U3 small nucleolar RNA-associated protein 3